MCNRNEYLLKPNLEDPSKSDYVFTDKGEIFRITKIISIDGGTSVLYGCKKNGSNKSYVIKECFPKEGFRRERGNIVPIINNQESRKKLQVCKDALQKEVAFSQELDKQCAEIFTIDDPRKIVAINVGGQTFEDYNGMMNFMADLSNPNKGLFLSSIIKEYNKNNEEFKPLPFIVTKMIIKQILETVSKIHNLGHLHLDIQPGNIYFLGTDLNNVFNQENETTVYAGLKMACLIDYATMKDLIYDDTLKKYRTADSIRLFETEGYTSDSFGRDYLEYKDDIFSIGVLFYYLLTGDTILTNLVGSGKTSLSIENLDTIDFNIHYIKNLTTILNKALNIYSDNCYHSCQEMIDDLDAIYDPYMSIAHRVEEKNIILNRNKPLVLIGESGMGKTVLAKHCVTRDRNKFSYVNHVEDWDEKVKEFKKNNPNKWIIYDTNKILTSQDITDLISTYPNLILLGENSEPISSIEGIDMIELKPLNYASLQLDNTMAMVIIKEFNNSRNKRRYNQLLKKIESISIQESNPIYTNALFGTLLKECKFSKNELNILIEHISLIFINDINRIPAHRKADLSTFKKFEKYHWLDINSENYITIHINTIKAITYLLNEDKTLADDKQVLSYIIVKGSNLNRLSYYEKEQMAFAESLLNTTDSNPFKEIVMNANYSQSKSHGVAPNRGFSDKGISERTGYITDNVQDQVDNLISSLSDHLESLDEETLCIFGDYYHQQNTDDNEEVAIILYNKAKEKGSEYAIMKLKELGEVYD